MDAWNSPSLAGTAARSWLIPGIVSQCFFFFGNVGAASMGIVPAVQSPDLKRKLSSRDKVALWAFFYGTAKKQFVVSLVFSTATIANAARLVGSGNRNLPLLTLSAAFSLVTIPFTVLAMMPLNNSLERLLASGKLDDDSTQQTAETVDGKIERWRQLHLVRMVFGAAGLVLSSFVLLG